MLLLRFEEEDDDAWSEVAMLDCTPSSTVEMAAFSSCIKTDDFDVQLLYDDGRTSARIPLDEGSTRGVWTDETDRVVEVGE